MWNRIKSWFKNSETIFLARIQMLAGALIAAVASVDPTVLASVFGVQYLPFVLIAHGALIEYLRRRRDDEMN